MKKYIITLAAMALAIGGSINFAGCSGEPDTDPNAVKGEEPAPTGASDADKEAAKKAGFDIGNEDAPEGTGEDPKK